MEVTDHVGLRLKGQRSLYAAIKNLNTYLKTHPHPEGKEYFRALHLTRACYDVLRDRCPGDFWIMKEGVNWWSLLSDAEYAFWADAYVIARLEMFPQYPIGKYFADFFIPHRNLIIEIDGKKFHSEHKHIIRDMERQDELEAIGYRVVRVGAKDVYRACDGDNFELKSRINNPTP